MSGTGAGTEFPAAGRTGQLLEEMFRKMPIGIAIFLAEGAGDRISFRWVALNAAGERALGLKESEIAGKQLAEVRSLRRIPCVPEHLLRALTEEGPIDLPEAVREDRNGSQRFSLKAFRLREGHVALCFEDDAGRSSMGETEARYRLFFEQDLTGDFIATPQGRMITCNMAFVRMLHLASREQAIAGEISRFFPDSGFWPELVSNLRRRRTLESLEFDMRTQTDNIISVRANIVGLFDRSGELQELRGSLFDVTQRKHAEEQLRSSTARLRALSAHLQSVREQERTSIARELHDELGQVLTGLKMDVAWLDNKMREANVSTPLVQKNHDMLKLIDSTIHMVRRITTELRPGILDDLGLVPALEWQAQEFQTRTGIVCEFHSNVENMELGLEFSTAVFRIFQESLTNVARHSGATGVRVRLEKNDAEVVLRVSDNGRGVSPAEISRSGSFGVVGMQERAFLFGGQVKIEGQPGGGTVVMASFPLQSVL